MNGETMPVQAARMAFVTNKAAARALAHHAGATDPEQPPYDAFPYSWQAQDFTPWWLVKNPYARPAYAHSKLEVRQLKYGPAAGLASVGFRVEKGFSPDLPRELRKPAAKQLGYTWAWHSVVQALAAGEVDRAAEQVLARSGLPLFVEVSLSAEHDSEDAGRPYEERVVLVTDSRPSELRPEQRGRDQLSAVGSASSLREVGEQLSAPNWQPHLWGSLRLGVRLGYPVKGEPAWEAWQLWERACVPWSSWLR